MRLLGLYLLLQIVGSWCFWFAFPGSRMGESTGRDRGDGNGGNMITKNEGDFTQGIGIWIINFPLYQDQGLSHFRGWNWAQ